MDSNRSKGRRRNAIGMCGRKPDGGHCSVCHASVASAQKQSYVTPDVSRAHLFSETFHHYFRVPSALVTFSQGKGKQLLCQSEASIELDKQAWPVLCEGRPAATSPPAVWDLVLAPCLPSTSPGQVGAPHSIPAAPASVQFLPGH